MDEKEKCCICSKEIEGMGNNPYPVRTEGRCCRYCNYIMVLPEKGRAGQYPRTRYLLRRGWRAVQDKADNTAVP